MIPQIEKVPYLDHLRISQKNIVKFEQKNEPIDCKAPYFAFAENTGYSTFSIRRGCCDRWNCDRCGRLVAEKHYGRIVKGATEIAENENATLYFLTVTCTGKEQAIDYYLENYLKFTNRFLNSAKYHHRKWGEWDWNYCQVTELQKRGAPHSHILTTFCPRDLVGGTRYKNGKNEPCKRSEWLQGALVKSGLGEQYDISIVRTPQAASRYIAKYMFKSSMFQPFPKRWHRVRYSQKWPKLDEFKTDAIALKSDHDWQFLVDVAQIVKPDKDSAGKAFDMLYNSGVLIVNPF